ncbi:hypothetical protein ACFYVL_31400 [Streptomyces sp. NPDC004111]|uniref:hypothetical protein n=1 Tax=Streptomyces sp. NPDC004111 TaxID=3364690 RepID=UPI0036954A96
MGDGVGAGRDSGRRGTTGRRRDPAPRRAVARVRRLRATGCLLAPPVAFLLLMGVAGLLSMPEAVAEEEAYPRARPCVGAQRWDCLYEETATVGEVTVENPESSKGRDIKADVVGDTRHVERLSFGTHEPLVKTLRPGDRVTVTLWRDYAVELSKDGVRQTTEDTPDGTSLWLLGLALALLVAGGWAAPLCWRLLFRAREQAESGWPRHVGRRARCALWCALGLIPAGVCGLVVRDLGGSSVWGGAVVMTAVWVVVCGVTAAVLRWRDGAAVTAS